MIEPTRCHLPFESDAIDVQEVLPLAGSLLPGVELHVRNHRFVNIGRASRPWLRRVACSTVAQPQINVVAHGHALFTKIRGCAYRGWRSLRPRGSPSARGRKSWKPAASLLSTRWRYLCHIHIQCLNRYQGTTINQHFVAGLSHINGTHVEFRTKETKKSKY